MRITKDFEKRFLCEAASGSRFVSEEVVKLLAHARALEDMLRKHEWDGFDFGDDEMCPDCCPECESARTNGHSPGCELARLLE